MKVYKRGGTWWFRFVLNGELIRESTKQNNKRIAELRWRARRKWPKEKWNPRPPEQSRYLSEAATIGHDVERFAPDRRKYR